MVAYALPSLQELRQVTLPEQSTIADAIGESGLSVDFPEIDLTKNRVGVFGRRMPLESVVQEGDRVEIYRPLTADPKESRRRRAEHARRARSQR